MKAMKKILSLLLALCMVFGLVPISAFAEEEEAFSAEEEVFQSEDVLLLDEEVKEQADTTPYRIVMLDCGRKYFSVDNVKKLIDTMAQYGYNQLTLAFGNGGCRFLLDDMSLSFGSTSMTSDTVKNNITDGNDGFNGDTRYWSQSDMDTIIAYANSKNIEIVPLLNMPGHAAAILYNTSYTSNGNLNVNDEASRNYGYALLGKYVNYFKAKGCKYFHFGADESGFSGTGMSEFLAGCAKVITDAGMTPRMFNDPADGTNTIPTGVQITYWYQNSHQSASTLANDGYSLINTHGRWYYVIKSAQNSEIGEKYWQGTVNSETVSVELPVMKQNSWGWIDIDTFFDNSSSKITNSLGTMFCIWCDASQDAYLSDSDVISENEDYGALYQLEKMAEHYWPDDIKTDSSNGDTGSDGETTGKTENVELTVGDSKKYDDVTADAGSYITNDDKYIATAEVKKTESTTSEVKTTVTSITSGNKYLILPYEPNSKVVTSNTSWGYNGSWTDASGLLIQSVTISNDNIENLKQYAWTITKSGDKYTVQNANGKYLNIVSNNTLNLSDTEVLLNVGWSNGKVYFKNDAGCYLNNFGGGNTFASSYIEPLGNGDLWTLYEVVEETDASSTLTITGVGEGTTTVTIGDTTYNITVTAPTVTETKKISINGTLNLPDGATGVNVDGTAVTYADGKLTAGDTEGTATVTFNTVNKGGKVTGKYTYNIEVITVDLTDVAAFDVTLWCTNTPIGKDENSVTENWNDLSIGTNATYDGYTTVCTPATMSVSAVDAYGEDGVELKDFVLAKGVSFANDGTYQEGREYVYWKGVALHDGDTQGHANAASNKDDKSDKGTNFYKIRYWNDQWQYLAVDTNIWTTVKTDDNFIAYYLQKFVPSDEVVSMTRDWGQIAGKGGGEDSSPFSWGTAPSGYIGVGSAVVYSDKSMSPVDDDAIWDETLQLRYTYNAGSNPGTIYIEEIGDYKITKVTITRGYHADSNGNKITTEQTVWNSEDQVLWDKVTNSAGDTWYDETVIWETGDAVDPVTGRICLGGTVWGDTWVTKTGNNEAFLILVYVEPVEKESNLKVVYWDDSTNNQINPNGIYITVKDGVTFLDIKQTSPVNVGTFTLDDDAYIVNSVDTKRPFNKNITIIDGVANNYKSGIYEYVGADISEDAKTLTLHYNIKKIDVAETYVVDFGLPLVITDVLNKAGVTNFSTVNYFGVSVNGGLDGGLEGTYGDVTITRQDNGDYTITYKLKKILESDVTIPIYYTVGNAAQQTTGIKIYPATSVFYEEDFLTYTGSWTKEGNGVTGNQATEVLGSKTFNYGYDDAYKGNSNAGGITDTNNFTGSYKKSTTVGDTASFSFTGTGFQLYANSKSGSGIVTVYRGGQTQKIYMIDTQLSHGDTSATEGQSGSMYYSLPIISETGLDYGNYTVTITHTNSTAPVYIDGVRILGTMSDSTIYAADLEDDPDFYELRDYVLKAIGVENGVSDYGTVKELAGQVYNGNKIGEDSAIVIDVNESSYQNDSNYAQDLLDNGPKNELYLYGGQTLVFKVKTNRVMQIGLKAPTGSTTYGISVIAGENETITNVDGTLNTSVDMFYEIAGKVENATAKEYTVTITARDAKNPLSVTLLKICDDPDAAFTALTQDDIENALMGIYGVSKEETPTEPVDPEEPTNPVEPVDPEEPTNPVEPEEPEQPEEPEEPDTLTTSLTVTYVNLFGKKVGSATLTKEMTDGRWIISAGEIRANAPAGRKAIWLLPVILKAGQQQSIVVPVF